MVKKVKKIIRYFVENKLGFTSVLLLLISVSLCACKKEEASVSSKSDTFIKIFGGSKNQYGSDIHVAKDGGYALLGSSNSFSGNDMDIYFIKTDAEGNEVWSKNYGNIAGKDDYGNAFLVNRDGDYILLGTTTDERDSTDLLLIKVNKLGEQVWERKIGDKGSNERGTMIKEDLDGNGFIIVGTTTKLPEGKHPAGVPESDISDNLIIRTDIHGMVTLSRTQGFNGPDLAHDVLPVKHSSGADEYIFVGTTTEFSAEQPVNGSDVRFFKNNKSLGPLESKTFGGKRNESGVAICATKDGGYAIVGSTLSSGNGGEDVFFVKLRLDKDNTITNVQEFTYGGSNDEKGTSVQELEDGTFIILGTTNSYGDAGDDIYLLKVNAAGEEVWARTFGDEGNERASKIIVTPEGGFVIIGSLKFGNNDMVYMIKTTSEGLLFVP